MGENKGYKGEVTPEMIQARVASVVSGTYKPAIPGLPGLVFVQMDAVAKGKSAREYSRKLMELMKDGGFFHEALLPKKIQNAMDDAEIPRNIHDQGRAILKRFNESIPQDLIGPIDELTAEEVAQLSEEQREARIQAIKDRFEKVKEFEQTFYTNEDREVMSLVSQVEELEKQLRSLTYEHNARAYQTVFEVQICSRMEENLDHPYFNSIDEILQLDLQQPNLLVELFWQWTTFKKGLNPQFFRPNSPLLAGMGGNIPDGRGKPYDLISGTADGVDSQPAETGNDNDGIHEPVSDGSHEEPETAQRSNSEELQEV